MWAIEIAHVAAKTGASIYSAGSDPRRLTADPESRLPQSTYYLGSVQAEGGQVFQGDMMSQGHINLSFGYPENRVDG